MSPSPLRMRHQILWAIFFFAAVVNGQNAGELTPEYRPPLPIQACDETGCQTENTGVVLDALYRRLYSAEDSSVPCYDWSVPGWNPDLCPDGTTCAENCALDGISQDEYNNRYGVSAEGNSLRINYLTESEYGTSIGGRGYLINEDDTYRIFYLKNRELSVTVSYENITCGMNGGLYFIETDADGGMARYPNNKAGARYGTGYCDAQCPHGIRYTNNEINLDAQNEYGICCTEMDILEGNQWAATVTTHGCNTEGYYTCYGATECGEGDDIYNGVCNKYGCEFSPARQNNWYFFGGNSTFTIDSTQPFTLITQFITDDGTDTGNLVEIRRKWIQNGVEISDPIANWGYDEDYDSLTEDYCEAYTTEFGEFNDFADQGGMQPLDDAFTRGMVLAFTLWEDSSSYMQWLDSIVPPGADPSIPGVYRGPCPEDAGHPEDNHVLYSDAFLSLSDIKIGTIGSTY